MPEDDLFEYRVIVILQMAQQLTLNFESFAVLHFVEDLRQVDLLTCLVNRKA
jgi:hypothetical protein